MPHKRHEYQQLSYVKAARAEEQKRRLRRPDKRLARDLDKLRRLYGLSEEAFYNLVQEQKGLCANPGCRIRLDNKRRSSKVYVDHCHTTGRVRGLLCVSCNSALGLLKESCARIIGLATYVEEKCRIP